MPAIRLLAYNTLVFVAQWIVPFTVWLTNRIANLLFMPWVSTADVLRRAILFVAEHIRPPQDPRTEFRSMVVQRKEYDKQQWVMFM